MSGASEGPYVAVAAAVAAAVAERWGPNCSEIPPGRSWEAGRNLARNGKCVVFCCLFIVQDLKVVPVRKRETGFLGCPAILWKCGVYWPSATSKNSRCTSIRQRLFICHAYTKQSVLH